MTIRAEASSSSASTHEPRELLRHVNALDGVRGTALLLAFCFHLFGSKQLPGHPTMNFLLKLTGSGWVGVDLFFALSGFLITGILVDSLSDAHYFRNFYVRRVCRIFPLYYGVILLLFLTFKLATSLSLYPLTLLPLFLQNTPLWWNHITGGTVADSCSHLWSLAVEEQFYLVWPLVVFLVRERKKLLWVTFVLMLVTPLTRIVLLAHGTTMASVYRLTACRADSLLAGACLALLVRSSHCHRIKIFALPTFFIALLGCFVIAWHDGIFFFETSLSISRFGYTFISLASASLIAMAIQEGSLTARCMSLRPLRSIGKRSFGLYVYQPLVSVFLSANLADPLHRAIPSPLAYRLCLEAIVLAITFPLAWLSFRYFEKPFLNLKRFFNYEESDQARVVNA